MKTRPLGHGAPAVSAIGFGGMPLSIQGRPANEQTSIRVIHSVLGAGVTLIDTADVYCLDDDDIGHNEHLIAQALRSWSGSRDRVVVATKGGLTRPGGTWGRDARPERLKQACERSLKALDVDVIDLYQLHAPDPSVPFVDSVAALVELQQEGKIRWIGLSNVSVAEIKTAAAMVPVVTVQNRLNPFFREALETGVVEHCAQAGIGFLAYSPVGGGRLNQKLPSHPALGPIAERHGVSAHAVVLAWVLARAHNVIPIPGARTVEHALDSLTAVNVELSPSELAAVDQAEFSRA
ncbi:MAG: aldo/keto reductase [Gemmatimonadales bacterium]|nr:aldo/keto reductase [Gemmatimonadales bacterium]NIN12982.1 aldo/keto reductase [Gemmatimonadales bacterium]NIN51059.1 aldo/keto reductase [Gemmatimonadales bacterium]NIP08523.1 aldo/keto reductase [Gemmatimonadales bacterium]NIR02241.1 aldo/keto reductase [Gemmatimonadales bacterium]